MPAFGEVLQDGAFYEKEEEEEEEEDDDYDDDDDDEEEEEEEEEEDGEEEMDGFNSFSSCQLKSPVISKAVNVLGCSLDLKIDKEKHISVDPVSLRQLEKVESLFSPAAYSTPSSTPPDLKPSMVVKPKFFSCSLPCSTTMSPQFAGSAFLKNFKKRLVPRQKQHHPATFYSFSRQQSAGLSRVQQRQLGHLRRSKSWGEGRACWPSEELDMLSSFHWPEDEVCVIYDHSTDQNDFSSSKDQTDEEQDDRRSGEKGFKCGSLCLFLPGFSKKKQQVLYTGGRRDHKQEEEEGGIVSRGVSLEKFECGSWSESAILDGDEELSCFDLPLEMIKSNGNDVDSPVRTAFVFERDHRKGVLKKSMSKLSPRKSHESPNRHVRFSTSNPPSPSSSCITPRLMKAREEFNTFLQAQGV